MQSVFKRMNEKYYIILIAFCVGTGLIIGFLNRPPISDQNTAIVYDANLFSFRNTWLVNSGNDMESSIELPNYLQVGNYETVSISNTLPMALQDGTYIAFKSTNAFVKVYIENELIYENTDLFASE